FLDFPGRELGDALAEGRAQGKDLEAAGVGHGRHLPVSELMQPTSFLDDIVSRLEIEMVGVGESHLSLDQILEVLRLQCLHRRFGAYGHEGRRLYVAVRSMNNASPGE